MKKGFTLIELLVVIAILAVLMSVVVVTINPAEMLKKTRDTKRISDLDALRTALNLYVTDVGNLTGIASVNCHVYVTASNNFTGTAQGCAAYTTSTSQASTGSGWIPLNFATISSGNPLSVLPIDPRIIYIGDQTSTGWHAYLFKASTASTTFKLMANMESNYYSSSGTGDVEGTDGGASTTVYEIGSDVIGL